MEFHPPCCAILLHCQLSAMTCFLKRPDASWVVFRIFSGSEFHAVLFFPLFWQSTRRDCSQTASSHLDDHSQGRPPRSISLFTEVVPLGPCTSHSPCVQGDDLYFTCFLHLSCSTALWHFVSGVQPAPRKCHLNVHAPFLPPLSAAGIKYGKKVFQVCIGQKAWWQG